MSTTCPTHGDAELATALLDVLVPDMVDLGALPPFAGKDAPFNESAAARLTRRLQSAFDGVVGELESQLRSVGRVPGNDQEINTMVVRVMASRAGAMRRAVAETGVEVATESRQRLAIEVKPARPKAVAALDEMSDRVRQRIYDRELRFADDSLNTIADDLRGALAEGYEEGLGIDDIAREKLRPRVGSIREHRLRTIARTEVQGSQNDIRFDTMRELQVALHQWITAQDTRVRGLDPRDTANHIVLHGEIVRVGESFSNGLRYPGDRAGRIEDWINCRCLDRPYFGRGPNDI